MLSLIDKLIDWLGRILSSRKRRQVAELKRKGLDDDLCREIRRIDEDEPGQLATVDEELVGRGMFDSGQRPVRHEEIRTANVRAREDARAKWRRAVEDLGGKPGDPPC